MIGRMFGLLWLLIIFSVGFSSGYVYWDFRDWQTHGHGHNARFREYVSDVFHLSHQQRKLLDDALAAKDRRVERVKTFWKDKERG